jgi:diguanylate cyclase (GGDEF)-like protein
LRWDLVGIVGAVVIAIVGIFLLDTGWLAKWMATNKDAKVDEIIVVSFVTICGMAVFWIRRWLGYSQRLIKFEQTMAAADLPTAVDIHSTLRRDLTGLSVALVIAVGSVSVLDTGSLAEWIARQSHTRVDEAIVATFMLMIGLSFFSIRRSIELSRQLVMLAELHRTTAKLTRESQMLGELSDLLQSCRSLDEAYPLIAERVQVLFPGAAGAIGMIANSRNVVDVAVTWGAPALDVQFFPPTDCWALRRGRTQILDHDRTTARCRHITPSPSRALCVPMMAHGEALGLLYLDTPKDAPEAATWSDAELRLAKTISEQTALALANLSLRDTLRLQSIRDPLTGLYNRRYLEESLDRELHRTVRTGASLGVMMIDVDHFKRLNDTSGHDAGDAVLRAFASLLRDDVRGEDVVCRYGGEEFTVVLPEASLEDTRRRAEAVREGVSRLLVHAHGQTIESVTVSIGVAVSPAHGTTGESLLRAADAALYRAKESGRNRVMAA